jgi:hypothetical protein
MLKSLFQTIKRLLLAVAGGLGGIVVGGILSLILLHLKMAFSVEISSFGLKVLGVMLICVVAGMIMPRFFMMFFLCPISWLSDSDSSGEGHSSGASDVCWPDFLFNASYMLGLVFFVFGVIFSLPWVAGVGLSGIAIFSFGVFRLLYESKGEGAPSNGDIPIQ